MGGKRCYPDDVLMIGTGLSIVNVGLQAFADTAASTPGVSVTHLDWRPPADGDPATARLVRSLLANTYVERANLLALQAYLATDPVLVDVAPAGELIDDLAGTGGTGGTRMLLHAGPPIDWASMCGPVRGALTGAVLFERWAETIDEAERLLAGGSIGLMPCHERGAVGPMAGIISPSMPLLVVEDNSTGRRAYSNLNEGLGKVLRFGAFGTEVIDRLDWMETRLGPLLRSAVRATGGSRSPR